jgi:hypothetical protein
MSIGLRVVGVYFNEKINIAVVPGTTTIKDVMDEAQKSFAGFSYSSRDTRGTLYSVTNKIGGQAEPFTLRDSDRSKQPVPVGKEFKTWQSYIIRGGVQIEIDGGGFTPFGQRLVEDNDQIVWRLVSVIKR